MFVLTTICTMSFFSALIVLGSPTSTPSLVWMRVTSGLGGGACSVVAWPCCTVGVVEEDEDESLLSSLGLAMMNATTATTTAPIRSPIRPFLDMAAAKYGNRPTGQFTERSPDAAARRRC